MTTIPPVPDADRYIYIDATSPVTTVGVTFAIYGSQEDISINVNGVFLPPNLWTLTSPSGNLSLIPLPITDGVITFVPPLASGFIEIFGAWQPRQVIQPTAPGISRTEFNQTISTLICSLRELSRSARVSLNMDEQGVSGLPGYWNAQSLVMSNLGDALLPHDAVNLETAQAVSAATTASLEAQIVTLQSQMAALQIIVAAFTGIPPTLPTTLPATAGVLWDNGGVVCIS